MGALLGTNLLAQPWLWLRSLHDPHPRVIFCYTHVQAIISRVVPPLNVGAIEPCSSDDDDDDVDDEGEGEEVEDGEPGEEEGEGVEREAEGGEEDEGGEDAEPYARRHGDEDPYGGQQDLDPHPGPDGRA